LFDLLLNLEDVTYRHIAGKGATERPADVRDRAAIEEAQS
jgi:hypothetical protein